MRTKLVVVALALAFAWLGCSKKEETQAPAPAKEVRRGGEKRAKPQEEVPAKEEAAEPELVWVSGVVTAYENLEKKADNISTMMRTVPTLRKKLDRAFKPEQRERLEKEAGTLVKNLRRNKEELADGIREYKELVGKARSAGAEIDEKSVSGFEEQVSKAEAALSEVETLASGGK